MGVPSISIDSVPLNSFTPQEPLVELLRICLGSNVTPFLSEAAEKPFLVTWLMKEWCKVLQSDNESIVLVVDSAVKVELWRKYLGRLTSLRLDSESKLIISCAEDVEKIERDVSLLVVDNGHILMQNESVKKLADKFACNRIISLASNILRDEKNKEILQTRSLVRVLNELKLHPEACSDLMSMLRFFCHPDEQIVLNDCKEKQLLDVDGEIDQIVDNCYQFFNSHHFSLLDIYGEEFQDLIEDVPDPTILPLKLLDNFVQTKKTLGLWSAERAALLLIIKIDKLKTREKYERHFLLLGVLYTEMVKIRKICEEAFEDMPEIDRITKHSTPKLLRLVDILRQYKPDHICRSSASKTESNSEEPSGPPEKRRPGGGGKFKHFSSYDDPNALCGVVFVENKFAAKILYHFLKDLSRSDDTYSFLMPQYATDLDDDALDDYDLEVERKRQEDSLRRFRMRECNLLVSSSHLHIGVDNVRCNLVIAFDMPRSFKEYTSFKVKAKAAKAYFLIFCPDDEQGSAIEMLNQYRHIESILKSYCTLPGVCNKNNESIEVPVSEESERTFNPFYSINRYCSKLPSDTFTRLTPIYGMQIDKEAMKYTSQILLPINCPIRSTIKGSTQSSPEAAQFSAALEACKQLRSAQELDENMLPYGRESHSKVPRVVNANPQDLPKEPKETNNHSTLASTGRPGTTKRRQYYYKQICASMSTSKGNEEEKHCFNLYAFKMKLTCALPDEQNTRGRKIHPPEKSALSFGILVQKQMPPICDFPIYTRDGEIFVSCSLIEENLRLNTEEMERVLNFHKYTFSQVLRLEKYPMLFKPDNACSNVIVVPLSNTSHFQIDWTFLSTIDYTKCSKLSDVSDQDRAALDITEQAYTDAVVSPWYRNQDQPQFFYVAEVCKHLSPRSDFPGQGFDTFEKYYKDKYSIKIQHLDQPLLDVDHTSARLNFLTPRYVNRKGMSLPTSSEETKRSKRENLEQKQILVPELCAIHPFPASLWRQAVCLPCVLYRLNSLLVADSLRRLVASEMSLGLINLEQSHKWPPLSFGWTLSDVIQSGQSVPVKKQPSPPIQEDKSNVSNEPASVKSRKKESPIFTEETPLSDLSCKLMNKLNEEESKLRQKSNLEIGTWSNEMASDSSKNKTSEPSEEDDEEFEEMFDPNIALPDNLTFLDDSVLPQVNPEAKDRRDWGTGIAQKKFRVGSPTFFSNPNINIPGLLDDYDGFSCSDSEDEDDVTAAKKLDIDEVEDVGNVRIEFRGRNLAEAIEDEEQTKNRIATLAKNQEEDQTMIQELPWDLTDCHSEASENQDYDFDKDWTVIQVGQAFSKDQHNHKCVNQPMSKSLGFLLPQFEADCELLQAKDSELGVLERASDIIPSFSFDLQPDLVKSCGPSPSLLLQALTMSNSNDVINLERLETIGDSFLKYAVTSFLYCTYPNIHEGKLSHLRSKQVSNLNLYRLGKDKRLGELMVATKFEPHDNWLPPGYHIPAQFEQALIKSGVPATHWNMADMPDISQFDCDQITEMIKERNNLNPCCSPEKKASRHQQKQLEDMPSFVPYNLLTQHSIPDKSIADCVEALIGAYLTSCGTQGALLFMSWIGLTVLPKERVLLCPPSPLNEAPSSDLMHLQHLLKGFDCFEETIGYKFRDRSYLLQAFSHASYYPNRLTDCYQRLEFLGDAVLDYLITRHLFEDERQHSPGTLTDLRSALVNNTIFATLAVKYNFHKYFLHFSPSLHSVVSRFVKMQSENEGMLDDFYLFLEEQDEQLDEAEDVEVPKALGDIFESVAGAIFLDSGLSLDAVWRVYYRMMNESIDIYSNNVPKSPIREILELEPETAQFGKPEKLADGRRVRCTLEIIGKGVFKGIGRSYRIAKCTAAKCALRALKANHQQGKSS